MLSRYYFPDDDVLYMFLQHWVKVRQFKGAVRFVRTPPPPVAVALPAGATAPPPGFSENDRVRSPLAGDGRSTLVPWDVVDVGVASYLAEVDGLLAQSSVETWSATQTSRQASLDLLADVFFFLEDYNFPSVSQKTKLASWRWCESETLKLCSIKKWNEKYRTVFESHSQLKLKSGATYCINPEVKPKTCPIFPALLGCGDVPPQLQNKVKQKTFPPTSNDREHQHVFWAFSAGSISPFVKRGNSHHGWCPTNRTNTNVKTSAASGQECDIYEWLKPPPSLCTSGRSCHRSRTTAAVKTFSNTCQERMKQSVYRVWRVAGRLWAACRFCRPGTSRQTDSGPRRSQTDRRCCGIYLRGEINRDG